MKCMSCTTHPSMKRYVRRAIRIRMTRQKMESIDMSSAISARFDTLNSLMFGMHGRARDQAANLTKAVRPDVVHWHNTRGFIGVPTIFGGETALYTSHDYGSVCPRFEPSQTRPARVRECEMVQICCTRWWKPPQLWRIGSKRVLKYPDAMKIIAPSEFLAERLRTEGVRVTHS